MSLPDGLISFGPDANCTLAICPVTASVYQYRPSLAANATILALFGLCMVIQIVQGIKWKSWGFMTAMVMGCISELIGYGGRIMLYQNPFSFTAFMMQIVCVTIAPVFFSAAIYVMLSKVVVYLGRDHSRLPPNWYYYIFIACDIFSLVLQSVGGALSTSSSGSSQMAVDIALAGLSFQVITLVCFIGLCCDFAIRWRRSMGKNAVKGLTKNFKIFAIFLSAAIILILTRCAYRIDELSQGYSGPLISNQGLFIALEGVMIILAAFCLIVAHPGPAFAGATFASPALKQTHDSDYSTTEEEKV